MAMSRRFVPLNILAQAFGWAMPDRKPAARLAARLLIGTCSATCCAASVLAQTPQGSVPQSTAAGARADRAQPPGGRLEEVIVTARKAPENAQNIPVAVTALSTVLLDRYEISSLEKAAELTPGLIITRGNSGSGADISLRGIGSSFSSIGIEQSVAVVVDGVYYGQGRVIDEGFVDLNQIEVLKGPQALFFGKNSTAGVISISSADPGSTFEARARVGYEFTAQNPSAEFVLSGPVSSTVGLRLVVSGQNMLGGYVRNNAAATTYTTTDAATFASTAHAVPAPSNRDLPANRSIIARFTATYRPDDSISAVLKASVDHDRTGGTTWNDTLWKCRGGVTTFPGDKERCGDRFQIEQNPVPQDIAATRPDLARYGGQLYTLYDSHGVTLKINKTLPAVTLTSVTNYQYFDYSATSDYDFVGLPVIWSDEHDVYSATSEEARAQTTFSGPVNLLGGIYYQSTKLDFAQGSELFGVENSLAPAVDRYLGFAKRSATSDETIAGYGQLTWKFLPGWEWTAGARYTDETKNSFFVQPYVNPFLAAVFPANALITAKQNFHNISPETTITWKPNSNVTLYAAYKTGYKSGGFSNSASISVFGSGVKDLAFRPETVRGVEGGIKATLLDDQLRLNMGTYYYTFYDLQVDFYDSQNLTLVTTNAGSAITKGFEVSSEYLPPAVEGLRLSASLQYNIARYKTYIAPCYAGETQGQGCNPTGPTQALRQDLSGKPTADAPEWTGLVGADYSRSLGDGLRLGLSADVRFSSSYSVSPFAESLDVQGAYASLDAMMRVGAEDGRWELALIGKNLTNNFVVTAAFDESSTGSASGGKTGVVADQFGLFGPPRTVELRLTCRY